VRRISDGSGCCKGEGNGRRMPQVEIVITITSEYEESGKFGKSLDS